MEKVVKRYFLVTDRKSLDRGKLCINPIPISIKGELEYIGDFVVPIENNVIQIDDDGSKAKFATFKSISRMDGVLEITEKLVEKIIQIGIEKGFVEV